MTPSRAQRLQLYEELVKEFGDEPAMTLMESLPPVDWHELATKDDLAALEACLESTLTQLAHGPPASTAAVGGDTSRIDRVIPAVRRALDAYWPGVL